jgi:tetratricopeptide (TPR) repeat protein
MAELGDLLGGSGAEVPDEYVPVEWLDYTYIENCNDEKKLRQIIEKLNSGQEGYYPDLVKAGEEKLLSVVSPAEKNRILRLRKTTTPEEIDQAEKDLSDWQNVITNTDKKLRDENVVLPLEEDNGDIFTSKINKGTNLPPVRGSAPGAKVVKNTITTTPSIESDNKEKEERLSGYNFGAWEKFNVDDAIDKIDEDDNKREKSLTDMQAKYSNMEEDQRKRRDQFRQKEKEKILHDLNANELSELQRKNRAEREKQKGNECFKIGENEEAFTCYSRSIALDGSSAIVYANRAMTGIKLDRYEIAEDDCTMSISLDKNYVKAWMRRGMTRFKQGKYALVRSLLLLLLLLIIIIIIIVIINNFIILLFEIVCWRFLESMPISSK